MNFKSFKKIAVIIAISAALGLTFITAGSITLTNTGFETTISASDKSNALYMAKIYAKSQHMSKSAVYHQLISKYGEGFSKKSARYAIKHIHGVSWNKNAKKSAKYYKHSLHMSTNAVYHQLKSKYGDRFTKSQAWYGARHA